MKRLKNELNSLVNRGIDRHLRLAVTGLSRSGKTAFITAMVNQLLNIHAGSRLPLLSAVREERLLGVKRVPQRDFGIPGFTYDEGLAQLYGQPPAWPTPTRGVSEIRLALRYKSNDSLLRHFKDTSTLYLEIVDYPGEWLLDLPMLAQDYLSWSRQMTGLLQGLRGEWSAKWRQLCQGLDPLAPADENRLAEIAAAWTAYLHQCKQQGLHFIQPGRFVLPGDMAGAPALQFFPWPDVDAHGESILAQADKHTNAGMLRERFSYYCEKVVKGFYKNHFLRFDRQIVLVDCLGLASIQATQSGLIEVNGEKIPALRGDRLSDGQPLTIYPGEVPARLPGQAFWQQQGFQFENFRPQVMDVDRPLPHIRLDAALEFLIGDKLR